jgi:beta-aspartyl-dipeptidase (metallo-type)
MFLLIENGDVFTPDPLGKTSVLSANGTIAKLGRLSLDSVRSLGLPVEVMDASDAYVFPGLIDPHEHLIGGSGESGFASATPEIQLQELVRAGITSVVGCLGVDTTTKTMPALLAKVKGLRCEGIAAFLYSGGYNVPPVTLTGSVRSDMLLVEEVIGAGETALADLRCTQPSTTAIAGLVADAYVGGILSGKAGVTHFHVGPGRDRLRQIRELLSNFELQPDCIYLTHVERTPELMDEAIALTHAGVTVDIDTSDQDLRHWVTYFKKNGGDLTRLTISSDAAINSPESLSEQILDCMEREVLSLPECLSLVTRNTARVLKLNGKGELREGADCDLIVVNRETRNIRHVVAKGKTIMRDGNVIVRETSMAKSYRRIELEGVRSG